MNNYVTLDSKKYTILLRSWRPVSVTGKTIRPTLNDTLDITFGPTTFYDFSGEIVAPVTARGTGWGTISDLRTTLAKKQTLTFVDHYGTSRTIVVMDGEESSRSAQLDSGTNSFYVKVRMVGK